MTGAAQITNEMSLPVRDKVRGAMARPCRDEVAKLRPPRVRDSIASTSAAAASRNSAICAAPDRLPRCSHVV